MKTGIVYVAVKDLWVRECVASIRTVRRYSQLPITVFTPDVEPFKSLEDVTVRPIPVDGHIRQIYACAKTPYRRTLFLDTDTAILSERAFAPFKLLNRFPIAVAHAPVRGWGTVPEAPNCFPQFNIGVIFYRSDMIPIMEQWFEGQKERKGLNQPLFTSLLYKSNISFATLTPEWNYRGNVKTKRGWEPYMPNTDDICIAHQHGLLKLIREDGSVDKEGLLKLWAPKI